MKISRASSFRLRAVTVWVILLIAVSSHAQIMLSPGITVSWGFGKGKGLSLGAELSVFNRIVSFDPALPAFTAQASYHLGLHRWTITGAIEYAVMEIGPAMIIDESGSSFGLDLGFYCPVFATGPAFNGNDELFGYIYYNHIFRAPQFPDINELGVDTKYYNVDPVQIETRLY